MSHYNDASEPGAIPTTDVRFAPPPLVRAVEQPPVAPLLRTRCKAGWLVITQESIRIERGAQHGMSLGGHLWVMPRKKLTEVSGHQTMPSLFGAGGASTLVFTGQGGVVLRVELVNPKDAQRALELLGYA